MRQLALWANRRSDSLAICTVGLFGGSTRRPASLMAVAQIHVITSYSIHYTKLYEALCSNRRSDSLAIGTVGIAIGFATKPPSLMAVAQIQGRHQFGMQLDPFRFVFFLYTCALKVSKKSGCDNWHCVRTVGPIRMQFALLELMKGLVHSLQVSWP